MALQPEPIPTVLRTEAKDYGGVSVFTDASYSPIYIAPHLLKTHWDGAKLTAAGVKFVGDVLAARVAQEAADAKEARWDAQTEKARQAIEDKREASGDTAGWTNKQIEDAASDALKDEFNISAMGIP